MITRLITWLYVRYVYMPALREKLKKTYPHADVVLSDKNGVSVNGLCSKQMARAEYERKYIPDNKLH